MDVLRYGIRRRNHEAHVWVFGFSQRRRHAYIDCVQCPDDREIGGRAQFPALDEGCKRAVGNVFDIGLTGVELVYFGSLNINANNVKPGFCELDCERQANVTETKNPNPGFLVSDFGLQLGGYRRSGGYNFLDQECRLPLETLRLYQGTATTACGEEDKNH